MKLNRCFFSMKKIVSLVILMVVLVGCQAELARLKTPQNLHIENGLIQFSKVENATNYIILMNGKEIPITETTYQLNDPGIYLIKVKAQAKGYQDSTYTKEITYTFAYKNDNFSFTYSLKSDSDLPIFDIVLTNPKVELDGVNQSYIYYSNNMIQIKKEFLHTLTVGKHDFALKINESTFAIYINIMDIEEPYLMINNNYYFDSAHDIVVRFDSFGYQVYVSGNLLSESDFIQTENKVILDKHFIEKYFEENPHTSMYILTIHFENEEQTKLARIWLHNKISN